MIMVYVYLTVLVLGFANLIAVVIYGVSNPDLGAQAVGMGTIGIILTLAGMIGLHDILE